MQVLYKTHPHTVTYTQQSWRLYAVSLSAKMCIITVVT